MTKAGVLIWRLTARNKPALGVSPPKDRAEHSSSLAAPLSAAFLADSRQSTHTSNSAIVFVLWFSLTHWQEASSAADIINPPSTQNLDSITFSLLHAALKRGWLHNPRNDPELFVSNTRMIYNFRSRVPRHLSCTLPTHASSRNFHCFHCKYKCKYDPMSDNWHLKLFIYRCNNF